MDYEAHPDEWVFAGSRPAVIDFYTTWCGPCKMMGSRSGISRREICRQDRFL